MTEYISRESVLDKLAIIYDLARTDQKAPISCAISDIKSIPAADVQTVKHGRWLPSDSCITAAYGTIHCQICSECGADLMEDNDYDYDFCPVCGARMDGETNE